MNDGFLLIDKDNDYSSNKIDQIIKHKYNLNKVGHLGTLDPLAKGLLVIGVNFGTRYFKYFDNLDKAYVLTLKIGETTPSLDNETDVTVKKECDLTNKEEYIDSELKKWIKTFMQVPPIYSAIKVNGVPSYKRTNDEVNLKERSVTIYNVKRLNKIYFKDGCSYLDIELHVSKGFYVRSFAFDFSKSIGYPGMAHMIRRIKVGEFNIDDSFKLSELNELNLIDPINYLHFDVINIDDNMLKDVLNGVKLKLGEKDYYLLKHKEENIAIYKKDNEFHRMDLLIKQ